METIKNIGLAGLLCTPGFIKPGWPLTYKFNEIPYTYNMLTAFCVERFSKMSFPRRAGQRTSKNGLVVSRVPHRSSGRRNTSGSPGPSESRDLETSENNKKQRLGQTFMDPVGFINPRWPLTYKFNGIPHIYNMLTTVRVGAFFRK